MKKNLSMAVVHGVQERCTSFTSEPQAKSTRIIHKSSQISLRLNTNSVPHSPTLLNSTKMIATPQAALALATDGDVETGFKPADESDAASNAVPSRRASVSVVNNSLKLECHNNTLSHMFTTHAARSNCFSHAKRGDQDQRRHRRVPVPRRNCS